MANLSKELASDLLQIYAIKLSPAKPFTWASGMKSPIYCDNRQTLSHPWLREKIRNAFVKYINENYPQTDVIAGVATGGIAQAALVADKMDLPMIYVRSGIKKHGLGNHIEGYYEKGQKVVVIEDLVSTGGSSLSAVEALRDAGMEVLGMVAIFTYGLEVAAENFSRANCNLHTLSNFDVLLQTAVETDYIKATELESLKKWRENPQKWSEEKM